MNKTKTKTERAALREIATGQNSNRANLVLAHDTDGRCYRVTPRRAIPLTLRQALDLFAKIHRGDGLVWNGDGLAVFLKAIRSALPVAAN